MAPVVSCRSVGYIRSERMLDNFNRDVSMSGVGETSIWVLFVFEIEFNFESMICGHCFPLTFYYLNYFDLSIEMQFALNTYK